MRTTRPVIGFCHGQESGPWGTKIRVLAQFGREAGFAVESLDYRGLDPEQRVRKLLSWCTEQPCAPVLVGSSLGAHVALAAAAQVQVTGLFLLAAAVYVSDDVLVTPAPPRCPVVMVHGWNDEVVPVDSAVRYAREAGYTLHLLDGGHRLTENLADIRDLFGQFLARMSGSPAEWS